MAFLTRCLRLPVKRFPQIGRASCLLPNHGSRVAISSTQICPMALSAPEQMREFWKKQKEQNRPLSPHLAVYKMELPMVTSLIHRGTGIAMYGGVVILAVTVCALPDYSAAIESLRALGLPSPVWWAAKTFMCWPLVYHYTNGTRHLAWDVAVGFDTKTLYKTGYFAIGFSFLAAAILGAM